jgi:hypothetical protein
VAVSGQLHAPCSLPPTVGLDVMEKRKVSDPYGDEILYRSAKCLWGVYFLNSLRVTILARRILRCLSDVFKRFAALFRLSIGCWMGQWIVWTKVTGNFAQLCAPPPFLPILFPVSTDFHRNPWNRLKKVRTHVEICTLPISSFNKRIRNLLSVSINMLCNLSYVIIHRDGIFLCGG